MPLKLPRIVQDDSIWACLIVELFCPLKISAKNPIISRNIHVMGVKVVAGEQFLQLEKKLNMTPLVLLVLSVLVVVSIIAPVAKAAPSITLSPTSGPPGTTVAITCSGFTPNGQVQIFINGVIVATTIATSTGAISTSFTVPNVSVGSYNVDVKDLTTQDVAQTTFTVLQSQSESPSTVGSPSPSGPSPSPGYVSVPSPPPSQGPINSPSQQPITPTLPQQSFSLPPIEVYAIEAILIIAIVAVVVNMLTELGKEKYSF